MSFDIISAIIFIAFLAVLAVALISVVLSFIAHYEKNRATSSFKDFLREAIINSQPTWNQVRLMASTRPITTADISKVVRELLSEALSGSSARLKPHVALIESYIDADRQDEPFEDMPQEFVFILKELEINYRTVQNC